MATTESQRSLTDYTHGDDNNDDADELDTCPECGESAMSEETPCSRCQPPHPDADEDEESVDVGAGEDRCHNCGSHVSSQWARVFGDNNNEVHACPECAPSTDHFHGAAAGVDTTSIQRVQR